MTYPTNWLFPTSTQEAHQVQKIMADHVIIQDMCSSFEYIGGMDVSNNLYDPEQMVYAAVIVLSFTDSSLLECATVAEKQVFPYVPGLLGFREVPALIHAFNKLKRKPDLLLVDGHGISHPRGLGIASHLGVLLDIPTIGVAKSILVGHLAAPLGVEAGSCVSLLWKDKQIATVLRSKKRSNPLIISTGHKISSETAVEIVKKMLKKYRLPEPTRQAHLAANNCRKNKGLYAFDINQSLS
jgi:deoxyribonuclease V